MTYGQPVSRDDGLAAKRNPKKRPLFPAAVLFITTVFSAFPAAADVLSPEPFYEKAERYDYIIYCMLATAVIETLFFCLCGYRERKIIMYVFFINLLSNLLLNFPVYPMQWDDNFASWTIIAAFEAVVIAFEFGLLGFHTGWKLKIFLLLVASNALSYAFGELYYHAVYIKTQVLRFG